MEKDKISGMGTHLKKNSAAKNDVVRRKEGNTSYLEKIEVLYYLSQTWGAQIRGTLEVVQASS